MPVSGWDHFNDPLCPESTAVSSWRISLSSAEGFSPNQLLYVQLLTSDSLEHETFQIRINLTGLQNEASPFLRPVRLQRGGWHFISDSS